MRVILLIDDDVEDHDTIKYAFYTIDPGVHCICYSTADEAISQLKSHEIPHIHSVLLDVHMPRMSGLECLKILKTMPCTEDVNIIMMSSEFQEGDLSELTRHGAKALCVKPSTWDGYAKMAEMILSDNVDSRSVYRF